MSVKIVILCEDKQTECFIREFLYRRRKYTAREIRTETCSKGKASGEQWVRVRYPQELRAIRSREHAVLLVATDADVRTVDERIATLDAECRNQDVSAKRPDRRVAMLIPRRNIETWLAYLRGQPVDEAQTYPKYENESDCFDQARRLEEDCRRSVLPTPVPDSLRRACAEYNSLELP